MRIVFVVYHDLLTEARSQDTLKALESIGDVTVISQNELPRWSQSRNIIVPYENERKGFRYARFLNVAKKVIKEEQPQMVFLHDAITLIPFVKTHCPSSKIVCDQSELMVDRKNSNIRLFILNLMDIRNKYQLKKADLVICANEERAIITQFYYRLNKKPFVFENIHRIDDEYNKDELDQKYNRLISDKCKLVVYGGGVSKARKTYDIVRAIAPKKDVCLIVAGTNPEGVEYFHQLITELNVTERIAYIGFVPRSEWRYLLSIADISIVAFERNCWNNIYCASGKAFESLFEGTPILCSNNPPLERICREKHVGVATDDFSEGIDLLLKDIDIYKKDALAFAQTLDYESRIQDLTSTIKGVL